MTDFSNKESLKIQKEAEDLYNKYSIEVREYSKRDDYSIPVNEDRQKVLTIKLSNSTTPMACV